MEECRPWRNAVHGGMPSMEECRPWRNAVHGGMPSMEECRPWRNAVHGGMPSMEECRPWRNAVHGGMPSMGGGPWGDAIHGIPIVNVRQPHTQANTFPTPTHHSPRQTLFQQLNTHTHFFSFLE